MDSLPPCMQVLAEELSSLVIELTAGLLERPAPQSDQNNTVTALAGSLVPVLQRAVPALAEIINDINLVDPFCEEPDEALELVEDLALPALELVDSARRIWSASVPVEEEGTKVLLARLAEVPVVELLGQIQPLVHAAIMPEAFYEDAKKAKPNLHFSGNYTRERDELAAYCEKHNVKMPDIPEGYL